MGRGRAKAKQTKVARELKYHTPTTDLSALQRELGTGTSNDEFDDLDELDDEDDESDEDADSEDDIARWAQRPR
jgi:hypothetical protein